jgi:hypothetical protein
MNSQNGNSKTPRQLRRGRPPEQGNVENRWQSAKKRWHEQPATDSGRWKIMKKRGHDDRNAKTRFD